MGESAWVDMGAALKTLFWAQMGSGSAYTTLKLRQALVTMLWNASDYDKWASEELLPTMLIEGRFVRPRAREHGQQEAPPLFSNPARHIENEYLYTIFAIVQGEREEAERDCKILIKRIVNTVLTAKTLAVTDTSGESVVNMTLGGNPPIGVGIARKPSDNLQWYGIGAVGLNIVTKT